jgi:hypothetical protein
MILNYSKGKKENVIIARASPTVPVRPARPGVPGRLGLSAQDREAGELAPKALVDGGPTKFQRCRQRGAAGRVVDQFWGGGEEVAHRKNEHGEVWSAGGERWWGVVSGGSGRSLRAVSAVRTRPVVRTGRLTVGPTRF